MDCELSQEYEIEVGICQRSVLSPSRFAVVVDAVTELAKRVC